MLIFLAALAILFASSAITPGTVMPRLRSAAALIPFAIAAVFIAIAIVVYEGSEGVSDIRIGLGEAWSDFRDYMRDLHQKFIAWKEDEKK